MSFLCTDSIVSYTLDKSKTSSNNSSGGYSYMGGC